jgi:hypothetical protein
VKNGKLYVAMNISKCFAVSVLLTVSVGALAKDSAGSNPYLDQFRVVKPLDLPLHCAGLAVRTVRSEQERVVIQIVEAAVVTHPTATPAVVSSLSKVLPESAGIVAARACVLQPTMTALIVRAAASAAPNESGRITYSVCRSLPHQYQIIASAASAANPALSSEILGAVTLAVPELKSHILRAAARARGSAATVPDVVTEAAAQAGKPLIASLSDPAQAPMGMPVIQAPPRVGIPFVPLTGTPRETSPSDSGEVPAGGRDYASP